MLYVVLLLDGLFDAPVDELDGMTPLEVAETPRLDAIAAAGRQGTVLTIPPACRPSDHVGLLSLLGYDAVVEDPGAGPLEARGSGCDLDDTARAYRCSLVSVDDAGVLVDHTAGRIGTSEARALLEDLAVEAGRRLRAEEVAGLEFLPLRGHRALLVDTAAARGDDIIEVRPPHDLIGRPLARRRLRHGPTGRLLRDLENLSAELFADHEVNLTRRDLGEATADRLVVWGGGGRGCLDPWADRTGLPGDLVTGTDRIAGVARLAGLRLHRPADEEDPYGTSDGALDGLAAAATRVIREDADGDADRFVVVHSAAADLAAHEGDFETRIRLVERLDGLVAGPVADATSEVGDAEDGWRLLVTSTHYTLTGTRRHDPAPPPFAMAGTGVARVRTRPLTEVHAAESDLHVDRGSDLLDYFLHSGLDRPRRESRR